MDNRLRALLPADPDDDPDPPSLTEQEETVLAHHTEQINELLDRVSLADRFHFDYCPIVNGYADISEADLKSLLNGLSHDFTEYWSDDKRSEPYHGTGGVDGRQVDYVIRTYISAGRACLNVFIDAYVPMAPPVTIDDAPAGLPPQVADEWEKTWLHQRRERFHRPAGMLQHPAGALLCTARFTWNDTSEEGQRLHAILKRMLPMGC